MNFAQRQLALFEKHDRRRELTETLIADCPIIFAALGLIAGIIIQHFCGLKTGFVFLVLTVITFVSVIIFTKYRAVKPLAYLTIAGFICMGAVRLAGFNTLPANDIARFVTDKRSPATVRGTIVDKPVIYDNNDWYFSKFSHIDTSSGFFLKLDKVRSKDNWAEICGIIKVYISESVSNLKAGDYIEVVCMLENIRPPTNPGQFDSAGFLGSANIFVAAYVKTADSVKFIQNKPSMSTKIKNKLRQTAHAALSQDLIASDGNKGLLDALLLGSKTNIDTDTYSAFKRTGLLHFISLSGLHMAIIMAIIWQICTTMGLFERKRAIVCLIAVILFVLIVPARAPTVRAAVICMVFCISQILKRKTNPVNTLSLAAILLLLYKPTELFNAGWQLSFASILGILLFTERFDLFFHEKLYGLFERKNKSPALERITGILRKTLTLLSVGIAAWLGSAGIVIYHFHMINPLASLWTVIVLPFITAILITGFFKIVLFALTPISMILAFTANWLCSLMVFIVDMIDALNTDMIFGSVPVGWVIFYYMIILYAGISHVHKLKKHICTIATVLLVAFLFATKLNMPGLSMHCLDVGHGQAVIMEFGDGTNILFDAGSMYKTDPGRRIINPFLYQRGIKKLDAIIISHSDIDHINAVPEIAGEIKVSTVYFNINKQKHDYMAEYLIDKLSQYDLEPKALDRKLKFGKNIINVIWPDPADTGLNQLSDNNGSAVFLIEFASRQILLCSDIEQFAQRRLVQQYPQLQPDILLAPHHGSVKTTDSNFIASLDPDIIIASCGRKTAAAIPIEKQSCTQRYFTARDGAVSIHIDKKGRIEVETFIKKSDY